MKGSILGGRSLFITGTDKKGKSVTRQGKAVRATDFLFSSDRISVSIRRNAPFTL